MFELFLSLLLFDMMNRMCQSPAAANVMTLQGSQKRLLRVLHHITGHCVLISCMLSVEGSFGPSSIWLVHKFVQFFNASK
jgi:hypothetical protein